MLVKLTPGLLPTSAWVSTYFFFFICSACENKNVCVCACVRVRVCVCLKEWEFVCWDSCTVTETCKQNLLSKNEMKWRPRINNHEQERAEEFLLKFGI